jgi:integrase
MKSKIRKVVNCGSVRWLADLRCFNAGRKFFETEDEAKLHWNAKAKEVRDFGVSALNLTHEERIDFLAAQQKLKPLGARIMDAVEFYLKHYRGAQTRTLGEAWEEFIASKKAAGKRPRYVAVLKYTIGSFIEARRQKEATSVTREEIERWLYKSGYKPATIRSYLIDAKTFFGFCQRRGYISLNPCIGIERVTLDEKPPGILTVEQCTSLLNTARTFNDGRLLPYVALTLFAGIRPEEAELMSWENIKIDRGFVEVPALKAKTRRRRLVQLSENAKAWLKLGGPLPPVNKKRWIIDLRLKAGIKEWPKDCLRHSFASYHLAMQQSADKTATEMGHYSTDMLFKHYRELVTKEDAERFWAIMPGDCPAAPAMLEKPNNPMTAMALPRGAEELEEAV